MGFSEEEEEWFTDVFPDEIELAHAYEVYQWLLRHLN